MAGGWLEMKRASFTQADLKRAMKAAQAAGIDTDEVRIEPDGAIRILIHRGSENTPRDVRDEIERHFRART